MLELLEYVVDYNFSSDPERYLKVSKTMGFGDLNGKYGLINGISELKIETGVTQTLKKIWCSRGRYSQTGTSNNE